jgi:hypothetical protein
MDTLHCKRCGNIWTEETRGTCGTSGIEPSTSDRRLSRTVMDSPEQRMEKQMEGYLKKSGGKFSLYSIPSNIGDIQMAMFRRYLKKCVRNRTLAEKKDQYGIVWYSRPG